MQSGSNNLADPEPRGPWARRTARIAGAVLLGFVALFLLQFAVQALFNAPAQGVLVFVAAGAFALAALRLIRHQTVAGLLFLATLPLFIFSVIGTLLFADESPIYAVVSAIPPALSGAMWVVRRRIHGHVSVSGTAQVPPGST